MRIFGQAHATDRLSFAPMRAASELLEYRPRTCQAPNALAAHLSTHELQRDQQDCLRICGTNSCVSRKAWSLGY